ncbi:MAG: M42 family peptidase [Chloroflexota bacterium]
MKIEEVLRELSESSGVSGYETEARAIAQRLFAAHAHEVRTDALGNLIALRRGEPPAGAPRRSIMLAAHVDEIGLMVTGVEQGFLRFTRVGGVDVRTIVGQEVVVHGRRPLPGIVASLPPHVLSEAERQAVIPLDKLFIDVGLPEDRVAELVAVGDLVTMRREMVILAEGYLSGKAFDDRAGVVALALCLEQLAAMRHEWDVYAVATTQEEVGLRGAIVSAYGTAPDAAIAVDVGFGAQQGLSEAETIAMDGGPALCMGPSMHPLLYKRLADTAKAHEVTHQFEVAAGASGTDAWGIAVTRQGVPTALLSIPLRYMHTTVETVCVRDIERTARLMALTIAGLDQAFAMELGL